MNVSYIQTIQLIDRAHRQFMELLQTELSKRIHAPNVAPVEALLLFNLGSREMTVGDLVTSGCYLGSKVSKKVQKMIEAGWLEKVHDPNDRRLVMVRATDQAKKLVERIACAFAHHVEELAGSDQAEIIRIEGLPKQLSGLSEFWTSMNRPPCFRQPPAPDLAI